MMDFIFWKEWKIYEKIALALLSLVLLITAFTSVFFNVNEYSGVFDWSISAGLNYVQDQIYSDHSLILEASVDQLVPLVVQKSEGQFVLEGHFYTIALSIVIYMFLAFAIAVSSTLSRFWFVVGMGLLVVLVALSGFADLQLFGLGREMSIGIPALSTIVLAYYFHDIKPYFSLLIRWLALVVWFTVLALVINQFSESSQPLMALAYQGYWMALIFTIIFSLMVGHEIVYGILVLTTQSSTDKSNSNGLHFVVFSLIYLLNVAFVYMRNAGYIDWDFYYLNPFLLLLTSTILGVWGLNARSFMYDSIIPFRSIALYAYLALAVFSFIVIGYFQYMGNDLTMEVLEDAVIFGHIAFGGMFFVYVIVNFINLLLKGLPIYRVVFKEDNFPYATAKIAGLIVVGAFFFASNYAPMNQAIAGFFNQTGDFKLIEGRTAEAKEAYRKGAIYGNMLGDSNGGHRSNYLYSTLEDDLPKKITWLKNSTKKNPTPQSFINLGLAYEKNSQIFDAMFTYQEAISAFPENWAIQNNLAMLYLRMDVLDSAAYYLNLDNDANDWQSAILQANQLALDAQSGTVKDYIAGNRIDVQANELATSILYGSEMVYQDEVKGLGSSLNLVTYAYLKNLGLYCAKTKDDRFLTRIDDFLNNSANADYHFDLAMVKAFNLYELGKVKDAFVLMNDLYNRTAEPEAIIPMILGKWSMELGAIKLASTYFETARENGYPLSTADLVQSYAMMGDPSVAIYLWEKEMKTLDTTEVNLEVYSALNDALATGEETWTKNLYSFEKERSLLSQVTAADLDSTAKAQAYRALGDNNPFYVEGVLAAVGFFNAQQDNDQAYGMLLDAITVNAYSAPLIKAYIDQCLEMGLINYAESTVIRLIDVLDQEDYQAYEVAFEAKKEAVIVALDNW
ncbi:hypothetical protein [Reichenbachiella ulvae]|uniref:Tetratricopeptide repeat-containing protein n=1 Tax=Reichenbachiella ulvae TaxID=2980104 RepID=A0ABT3CZQ7_9BACT|nr:hypothetical protein [Reichenbachiella ulvae]MCV9388693.1 hypothetical protein [Reichenbachiella ulvae]